MVMTLSSPLEMVVLLAVLLTLQARASTMASCDMSMRLNTIPLSAGAGLRVTFAIRPVCSPFPSNE